MNFDNRRFKIATIALLVISSILLLAFIRDESSMERLENGAMAAEATEAELLLGSFLDSLALDLMLAGLSPALFPKELMGKWYAENDEYVEPSGWKEWYRVISVHSYEEDIYIEYGSLVCSRVVSHKLDGKTHTILVHTDFDQLALVYMEFSGDRLLVKAPQIIVNDPDIYKVYLPLDIHESGGSSY